MYLYTVAFPVIFYLFHLQICKIFVKHSTYFLFHCFDWILNDPPLTLEDIHTLGNVTAAL